MGAVDPVVIKEPRRFEFSDSKRHLSKNKAVIVIWGII